MVKNHLFHYPRTIKLVNLNKIKFIKKNYLNYHSSSLYLSLEYKGSPVKWCLSGRIKSKVGGHASK